MLAEDSHQSNIKNWGHFRYHEENSSKLGEISNRPYVKGKTKLILVDALYPLCEKGETQPDHATNGHIDVPASYPKAKCISTSKSLLLHNALIIHVFPGISIINYNQGDTE